MTENPAMKQIRDERRSAWYEAWRAGAANCNNCGSDYTKEEIVIIDGEKSCPKCGVPEDRTFYYCLEHGAPTCTACRHRV